MKLLIVLISAFLGMIPQGKAFLDPLQKRDSVLIADQLEYGFELQGVGKGTVLALPDFRLSRKTRWRWLQAGR